MKLVKNKIATRLALLGAVVLAACSGERSEPEAVDLTRGELTSPGQAALRVDEMLLQMSGEGRGALALRLSKSERERVLRDNGQALFRLSHGAKEQPVSFNDLGAAPDTKPGDGLFTGLIPVNLDRLIELNREISQLKSRSLFSFDAGSRVVNKRVEVLPIDLEALRLGRQVRLQSLGELGPFHTLGGVTTAAINPQKSLLVRSLPVIEDPARTMNPCNASAANSPLKKWTFGYLMDQMALASGLSSSAFVEQWLDAWRTQQIVSDSTGTTILDATSTAALANIDSLVINPWRQRSGGGALDLRIAPFRLQAILYRSDLAQSSPYGAAAAGNNAGELRFVFGLMEARDQNLDGDATDAADTCLPIEAAAIFEYGVPLTSCTSIKQWANDWVNLSALLAGSPAYGAALELLTEQVVKQGAAPSKPNTSALNQLRTNEIDLSGIWQMREFVITPGGGPLQQATTKNNPREHVVGFTSVPGVTPAPINLHGSAALLTEILASMSPGYSMPEAPGGVPFMGGASTYNFGTFWDHPALATPAELQARFRFSANTCSGCHTGETATTFYHVRPVGPGAVPVLSNFLQTSPFNVTDNRGLTHTFAEMDNRKQALASLANQTCFLTAGLLPFHLLRIPLLSAH